jgi:uncharacterized damage-inducible protein DinB
MRSDSLISALQATLRQDSDLLAALTPEQYRRSPSGHFKSSVGMHLRHSLDHFGAFFDGLLLRRIDYESRQRDTDIEQQPEVALRAIRAYIDQLEALRSEPGVELEVREENDSKSTELVWLPSSMARELQFLLGHTVHHNALIAMVVDGLGVPIPADFGVAPSTLRYETRGADF